MGVGSVVDGVLELEDDHRQTVNERDRVWDAALVLLNLQLVHHTEDVRLGLLEVDQLNVEVFFGGIIAALDEAVSMIESGLGEE